MSAAALSRPMEEPVPGRLVEAAPGACVLRFPLPPSLPIPLHVAAPENVRLVTWVFSGLEAGAPDGPVGLLALEAEGAALRGGVTLATHFRDLVVEFGTPYYTRIDAPATPEEKAKLEELSPEAVTAAMLAGQPITAKLTRAPGNGAFIGGLKVTAADGWFAARPSGTENIYKIYAESFKDEAHLKAIVSEAEEIVNKALAAA